MLCCATVRAPQGQQLVKTSSMEGGSLACSPPDALQAALAVAAAAGPRASGIAMPASTVLHAALVLI